MLGGYEVLAAALGGLLVGAIAMLWALTRGAEMDVSGTFDKLFSLLQALLLIRAGGSTFADFRAKVQRQQKLIIKQKVQRLQARLRELEGEQ